MKKNSYVILVLIMSILCLAISATFAWFQVSISNSGNTINTGKIIYTSKGYDKNGDEVTRFLSSKEVTNLQALSTLPDNANDPLFEENNIIAGHTNSVYISVVQESGSIDLDYSISFSLSGDIENVSIFRYQLNEVTNGVLAASGASLEAKIATYATANSSITTSDERSMSELPIRVTIGSLDSTDNQAVYRLDYWLSDSATLEAYTGLNISTNVDLVYAQAGSLAEGANSNTTYTVGNESELDTVLALVKNGDTIILSSNITYTKDLIITNPVNFIVSAYKLSVEGNIRIVYTSDKTTLFSFNGEGYMEAKEVNDIGGNFSFEAPNGKLRLVSDGSSSSANIFISNNFTVDACYDEWGFAVENAKICSIDGDGDHTTINHNIYVDSNTSVQISSGTNVGEITAVAGSTNIKVYNNGTISRINFTGMLRTAQIDNPQIDIEHISSTTLNVSLPTWSVKFVLGTPNTGNTRIKRIVNSGTVNILTSQTFQESDIEYDYATEFVVDNGTDKTDLTIYYQDKYLNGNLIVQSIADILDNYFLENPSYSINNVTKLTIVSSAKPLTAADFYISGNETVHNLNNLCDANNKKLTEIDLSNAFIENNTIPAYAFYQCQALKKLTLPTSGLTSLGNYSINQTNITEITIPATVTNIGTYALKSVKFIHMLSIQPLAAWKNLTDSVGYTTTGQIYPIILCNENYLAAYQSAFGGSNSKQYYVYCDGIIDDSGKYVLGTGNSIYGDGYYINCYASTDLDNSRIGTTTSSLSPIKVNGIAVTITGVSPYAYYFFTAPANTHLTFADSIKFIGDHAFGATVSDTSNNKDGIVEVDLNNITYIDINGFNRLYNLTTVDFSNVEYIGEYAFRCAAIAEAYMPKVKDIDKNAFNLCDRLTYVYLRDIEHIGQYAFSIKASSATRQISEFVLDCAPDGIVFDNSWCGSAQAAIMNMHIFVPVNQLATWQTNAVQYLQMNISTSNVYYIHGMGTKYGVFELNGHDIGQYVAYELGNEIVISAVNLDISGAHTIPSSNTAFTTAFNGTSKTITLGTGALDLTNISAGELTFNVYKISSNTIPVNSNINKTLNINSITLKSTIKSMPSGSAVFPQLIYTDLYIEPGVSLQSYSFSGTLATNVHLYDGEYSIPQYCFNAGTFATFSAADAIITSIGQYAFSDCDTVEVYKFAEVRAMATRAFQESSRLKVFSAVVSGTINSHAFYNCAALQSMDFGEDDSAYSIYISNQVFRNCGNLINVRIDNATQLGQYTFYGCAKLVSVSLPKVTEVGAYSFQGCTSLKEVFFPNLSTGFVGTNTFTGCTALEYMYFGYDGEMGNVGTTTLVIPSTNLTRTSFTVVSNCTNLILKSNDFVNSTLPTNLKFYLSNMTAYLAYRESSSTRYNVFNPYLYECPIAGDYTTTATNTVTTTDGTTSFSINFRTGVRMTPTSVTSDGVTYDYYITDSGAILAGASGTVSNATISVPSQFNNVNLTRIGYRAFTELNLTSAEITLPSTCTTLGAGACDGLSGLNTMDLGGVTTIETYAFYDSDNLLSVESEYVKDIYAYAFAETGALISVRFHDLEHLYSNDEDAAGNPLTANNCVFENSNISQMEFSNALIDVGTNATRNCNNLVSIILIDFTYDDGDDFLGTFYMPSSGVYYEFFNGDNTYYPNTFKDHTLRYYNTVITTGGLSYVMTIVTLGGETGWQAIGIYSSSTYPTTLSFPAEQLTGNNQTYYLISIGDEAMSNLSSLTSLTISQRIRKITGKAFVPLYNLTSIAVNSNNNYFDATNNCLYAEENYVFIAYPQNRAGTSFTVTGTYNSIKFWNTEYGYSNGAKSIGDYAFYGARNLTTVVIPASVAAIGAYAFYECNSNLALTLNPTHPPYLGEYALYVGPNQTVSSIDISSTVSSSEYAYNYQYAEYYSLLS